MTFFHNHSADCLVQNPWIFNQKRYQDYNNINRVNWCGIKNESGATILLACFQVVENQVVSLPSTPFAGIQFFNKVDKSTIEFFIDELTKCFNGMDIMIKQAPDFYQKSVHPDLDKVFLSKGFDQQTEINHAIYLPNLVGQDYIHKMELRKIAKCRKSGFVFEKNVETDFSLVYQFIRKCRQQQTLAINIDEDHFINLLTNLPTLYDIYTVKTNEGQLAACSITLKVDKKNVYNYLPAFDRTYKAYSPLALLTFELLQDLRNLGYDYLDLGISSIKGIPQQGLIEFKERMGAKRSDRYTYIRHT